MELKGKIYFIGVTEAVSDKFKKRELIVEFADNPQYPEFIKFEAIQDKTALLDGLKVGNDVEVFFNLKGREWTNKEGVKQYFNSLHIWKVNYLAAGESVADAPVQSFVTAEAEGDLPF